MGRRYIAGTGQLLLALIGAGFVIAWFVALMKQMVQAIDGNGVPHPVGWLVEVGGGLLVIAWFWALFTSLSLQRDARDSEPPPIPPQ